MAKYRIQVLPQQAPWMLGVNWQLRKYSFWIWLTHSSKGRLIDNGWAPDHHTATIRANSALAHHMRGDVL